MRSQAMHALMQAAKEIRVALETDGDRIGDLLNEQHPLPVGVGETAFDYRQHMQHLVLQLGSAVDHAVEAEDTHGDRLIRVSRLRDERKNVADVGVDKLVAARQGLESLYPRGGFELAKLSGETPRAPERLVEQLLQTVKLLRQPAVELRGHKVEGFNVDFDAVAGDLEARRQELRAAIDRLDSEKKEAVGTLLVKDEAIDELRRIILWVGRTAEGLFHLAGESDLADRIRSSTRRPERPSEQASQPPAEGPRTGEQPPAADEPVSEPQPATSSSDA